MEIWACSDIHGYKGALLELLKKIGFLDSEGRKLAQPPEDKHLVFLGDYIDRGDKPLDTLFIIASLMMDYPDNVQALMGNHDSWLYRKLKGNDVKMTDERKETLRFIKASPLYAAGKERVEDAVLEFYEGLPYHTSHVVDGVTYRFVHAFYDAHNAEKGKKKQSLMLYGPTHGDGVDEKGFPLRKKWYEKYDGRHGKVIFGHYSMKDTITEFDNAVCVDCGIFKTGTLGAYEVLSGRKEYVHGYTITRN